MKKIYCVEEDWRCGGHGESRVLACFETEEDARNYMDKIWTEEQNESNQFKRFDRFESWDDGRSGWCDGDYCFDHFCIEVKMTTLYSIGEQA